ncbi:MAG TPA: DUF2782 domain-containing protein [Burkholderiales bacterium]
MIRFMLRRIFAAMLLGAALPLSAQQPPKLEPLPEPPPPPPGVAVEQPGEPSVRIEPGAAEQIEEQVIDGRRVARVTTPSGAVYYLIEDQGDGPGLGNEGIGPRVRVPLWVIRQF